MVIGFNDDHWITLQKHIAKFIWNRNYHTAPAPYRIKRDIMTRSCHNGGFGLIELKDIVTAARIRRYAYLLKTTGHITDTSWGF
jgi:hypothetical protein